MVSWSRRRLRWHFFEVRPAALFPCGSLVSYHYPPLGAPRVKVERPASIERAGAPSLGAFIGTDVTREDRAPVAVTPRFARTAQRYRVGEPCVGCTRVKTEEDYVGPPGWRTTGTGRELLVRDRKGADVALYASEIDALRVLLDAATVPEDPEV